MLIVARSLDVLACLYPGDALRLPTWREFAARVRGRSLDPRRAERNYCPGRARIMDTVAGFRRVAARLRSRGVEVVEIPGWEGRGLGPLIPQSVTVHHTATSAGARGDYPSLRIVRDGRADLRGPLAQIGLDRAGRVLLIASGLANHAGHARGTRFSNRHSVGIEAEHPGGSAGWDPRQYRAYAVLCSELAREFRIPVAAVCGHKENALPRGRKTDPNFDMQAFRQEVEHALQIEPYRLGQRVLRLGMHGPGDVRALQELLNQTRGVGLNADDDFGPKTEHCVKETQRALGLTVDGVVGPRTLQALQVPTDPVETLLVGAIRDCHRSLPEDIRAAFGRPLAAESPTPDGVGRFNHFERGASIYWHPDFGAHPVYGNIRAGWERAGWEAGLVGYPMEAERNGDPGRRLQRF